MGRSNRRPLWPFIFGASGLLVYVGSFGHALAGSEPLPVWANRIIYAWFVIGMAATAFALAVWYVEVRRARLESEASQKPPESPTEAPHSPARPPVNRNGGRVYYPRQVAYHPVANMTRPRVPVQGMAEPDNETTTSVVPVSRARTRWERTERPDELPAKSLNPDEISGFARGILAATVDEPSGEYPQVPKDAT